jgi:hypothetical protein
MKKMTVHGGGSKKQGKQEAKKLLVLRAQYRAASLQVHLDAM